jgi:hypothetical protein
MTSFPSLAHQTRRFYLGWNDDAFRTPRALNSISFRDSRWSLTPVYQMDMLPDLAWSAAAALAEAIRTNDTKAVDEIGSAFRCSFKVSHDDAKKAEKLTQAGKQCYVLPGGSLVTGSKYADKRSATALPSLSKDVDMDAKQRFRQFVMLGDHYSVMELLVSAKQVCEGEPQYALERIAHDNAMSVHGEDDTKGLLGTVRVIEEIWAAYAAHRTLRCFATNYAAPAPAQVG